MQKTDHEQGVERIRKCLRGQHLPILPPHIVYSENYHPDICTRINKHFVVIDYVNSEGQLNFDVGGLTVLLLHKDIIDCCVAVVAKEVYPKLIPKIRRYRNPFLKRLVILCENEFESWLEEREKQSELWKPKDLEVISSP